MFKTLQDSFVGSLSAFKCCYDPYRCLGAALLQRLRSTPIPQLHVVEAPSTTIAQIGYEARTQHSKHRVVAQLVGKPCAVTFDSRVVLYDVATVR